MGNKVIRLDTMQVYPTAAGAADAIGVNRSSVIRAIKSETPCKGVHVAELPERFEGFDVRSDVVRVWCASEILRRAGFVGYPVTKMTKMMLARLYGRMIIASQKKEEEKIMKYPYWEEIKNSVELTEQLRTIVEDAQIACRNYQTDLYLYLDEETGEGRLEEFVNVGGNNWLEDDHIRIWIDREHNEDEYGACTEIGQFAEVLDIPYEDFMVTAREWYASKYGYEVEDDDIEWRDVRDMIAECQPLSDAYHEWFEDYVRDNLSDVIKDTVADIISSYDAEVYDRRERGDRDEQ